MNITLKKQMDSKEGPRIKLNGYSHIIVYQVVKNIWWGKDRLFNNGGKKFNIHMPKKQATSVNRWFISLAAVQTNILYMKILF